MTKTKDDLEECQLNLTRTQFNLDEVTQLKETYKNKYEVTFLINRKPQDAKNDLKEYIDIAACKDSIITTQKEVYIIVLTSIQAIRLKEEQINDLKKQMFDLEISLNQTIVNFKMKEDELDTLLMVIEGVLVYCFMF